MEECSWSAKRSIQSATIRKSTLLSRTGTLMAALSRLLVGAHRVDVFKGQILPGGEDGYHDEEFTAPKHLTDKLWEAFGSQRALSLLIRSKIS